MRLLESKKVDKNTANQQMVKETNLTLVFNMINSMDLVSRAMIATKTGLSPTTITSLTDELLARNIIIETGFSAKSCVGRKPILLEVNPSGGYIVSIELREHTFECYLFNLKCEKISSLLSNVDYTDEFGAQLVNGIVKLIGDAGITENLLIGLNIGIPALVDLVNNKVISSTVLPLDSSNDFYSHLKSRFVDLPIFLGNVSSFSAYAEKAYSKNGNVNDLVLIDISTGVGAGIISNGEIFTGSSGIAGELGHMSIDLNGPRCKCGSRGCLEVLISIPALTQRIIFEVMSGNKTIVNDMVGNDLNKITIDIIRLALDSKDKLITDIVDDIERTLSYGINNIINLLNPECIIIGGEIKKLGDVFIDTVVKYMADIEFKNNLTTKKIIYSELGNDSVAIGGAKYVLDNIFSTSNLIASAF